MGSVIGEIQCPKCKSEEAVSDYYYKSNEEYIYCSDCGYTLTDHYKRDDQGQLITKDGTRDLKFDNLVRETIENTTNYGAYKYHAKNGGGAMGVIETKEAFDEIIELFKKNSEEYEDAQVSYFDGTVIHKIDLLKI